MAKKVFGVALAGGPLLTIVVMVVTFHFINSGWEAFLLACALILLFLGSIWVAAKIAVPMINPNYKAK